MKTQARKRPRMREKYHKETIPAMIARFGYGNVMQVPRLEKIVVNMGVGKAAGEPKMLEESVACLRQIAGQQPVITKARKSISNFKLREGQSIGCKVTLRSDRMYDFFDRLVSIVIPRIRDFRGLSRKSVDGCGNYTMGVKEQIVFPEIDRDKISRISGMDICICTTAADDEQCLGLLEEMGMPFRK